MGVGPVKQQAVKQHHLPQNPILPQLLQRARQFRFQAGQALVRAGRHRISQDPEPVSLPQGQNLVARTALRQPNAGQNGIEIPILPGQNNAFHAGLARQAFFLDQRVQQPWFGRFRVTQRQVQLSASHGIISAVIGVLLAGHVVVRRIQQPGRRGQIPAVKIQAGHVHLIFGQQAVNRFSPAIGRQFALRQPHLLLRLGNCPGANGHGGQLESLSRNQLTGRAHFKNPNRLALKQKRMTDARRPLLYFFQARQRGIEPIGRIVARIELANRGKVDPPCGLGISRIHCRASQQVSGTQFQQSVVAIARQADRAQKRRIVLRGGSGRGIAEGVFRQIVNLNPCKLRIPAQQRVRLLVAARKILRALQSVNPLDCRAVFSGGVAQAVKKPDGFQCRPLRSQAVARDIRANGRAKCLGG